MKDNFTLDLIMALDGRDEPQSPKDIYENNDEITEHPTAVYLQLEHILKNSNEIEKIGDKYRLADR
ncbi:MAG: hypothetical protein ABEK36_04495 [Candidatus Aenigmatarchaeota archaeon]